VRAAAGEGNIGAQRYPHVAPSSNCIYGRRVNSFVTDTGFVSSGVRTESSNIAVIRYIFTFIARRSAQKITLPAPGSSSPRLSKIRRVLCITRVVM
jgi:hypothetical protein